MMRKNYTLFKRYALAFALFAITAIVIYSCKKDKPLTQVEIKNELIADAKTYFEDEVLNLPKLNNDPNFRHSIPKTPNWSKAIVKKISLGDAVVVSIKFDDKTFSRPAGSDQINYLDTTSYLMIYKDKKQKMHAEWVTLLPNKPENIANSPFVGIVAIEDWNGSFNRAYAFNGAEKYIPVYIREAVTYNKINYSRSTTCFEVEHWGSFSWADGPPTVKYLGSEIFCSEDVNGSGGGGGGSYHPVTEEEATPSDYITYYIDCNGDIDGTAIIDNNCGCIKGNTGIAACPPVIEVKQDTLQKYYPCMVKEVLNKLMSNNTYGKLIQPFQNIQLPNGSTLNGLQGLPNLTFGFASMPYGGSGVEYMLGGTGRVAPTYAGISSKIEFNTAAMGNASQLFLQVATIHETGHAYANYYIKTGAYGFPVDTTRYDTWAMNIVNFESVAKSEVNGSNFNDHSLFIENYIDKFVLILKELNGNAYTDKQYQMAAMYGLDNPGKRTYNYLGNGTDLYTIYKNKLDKSYSNLMSKYGITATELNTFYRNNLINVPSANKLPTNCP